MARIIIADDDEIVSEVVCNALMDGGHAAGAVDNGRDALAVIRARRPDLVILDCNMPEMSGVSVVQELRRSAEFYDLPILMLTCRRSEKDVELAHYAGANDYMKKPFDAVELVFRVEEILAKVKRAKAKKPGSWRVSAGPRARYV